MVTALLLFDVSFKSDLTSRAFDIPIYVIILFYVSFFFMNFIFFQKNRPNMKIFDEVNLMGRFLSMNNLAVIYIIISLLLLGFSVALGFNAKHTY